MTVLKTLFNEVFLFKPEQHKDQRGNFIEGFNQKTFNSILGKKRGGGGVNYKWGV